MGNKAIRTVLELKQNDYYGLRGSGHGSASLATQQPLLLQAPLPDRSGALSVKDLYRQLSKVATSQEVMSSEGC